MQPIFGGISVKYPKFHSFFKPSISLKTNSINQHNQIQYHQTSSPPNHTPRVPSPLLSITPNSPIKQPHPYTMKASLKFRDEQKPLLRAKVPLNILGMPFQSGIVAGDSKELTLNLATFFQSGPSIKLAYRPNDSLNPFSLIFKTGTGPFGSPLSTSMLMSCEFNLPTRKANPNNLTSSPTPIFMLHFKPRFGDFTFKKSQSSVFDSKNWCGPHNCAGSDDDVSIEVVESPMMMMGDTFSREKVPMFGSDSPAAGAIANLFSGVEVAARTTLPLMRRGAVNFRWGFRVPADLNSGGAKTTSGLSFRKIPFLVMDKIGVELVDGGGDSKKVVTGTGSAANADVAEACLTVKRQLEGLQKENGLLRNAVENLRREIGCGGGSEVGKYREFETKSSDGRKNEKKSSAMEGDASEELKKALKGATTTGA